MATGDGPPSLLLGSSPEPVNPQTSGLFARDAPDAACQTIPIPDGEVSLGIASPAPPDSDSYDHEGFGPFDEGEAGSGDDILN
jgi:hypothetical protein